MLGTGVCTTCGSNARFTAVNCLSNDMHHFVEGCLRYGLSKCLNTSCSRKEDASGLSNHLKTTCVSKLVSQ